MGLSFKNIKKWWKMVRGKSILHVNQGVGKYYSFESVEGYYNDLTEKVTLDKENYNEIKAIKYKINGFYFPIAIFQYGLGCYDLILSGSNDKELMIQKFMAQLDWAYDNQQEDGSWKCFLDVYPDHPYSSMAQGEGASLLIRGYIYTKNKKYLDAAKKAIDFMLIPINEGGTCIEDNDGLILYEFTVLPYVYNGWIFSIFGLIDYCIISKDPLYKNKLDKTLSSLASVLDKMDNGYWSMYRNDKTIASPFYHHLHIAQLKVLYDYTNNLIFKKYADKFEQYESSKRNRRKAFRKKSIQKIFSK